MRFEFDRRERSEFAGLAVTLAVATTGIAVLSAMGDEPRTTTAWVAAAVTAGFLALAVHWVSATLPRPIATVAVLYGFGLGLLLAVVALLFLLRGSAGWPVWAALVVGIGVAIVGIPALKRVAAGKVAPDREAAP